MLHDQQPERAHCCAPFTRPLKPLHQARATLSVGVTEQPAGFLAVLLH